LTFFSSILSHPIIRDILPMGRETVFIRRTVLIDFGGDIEDDGFLLADALPSMIDPMGHLNQHGMVDPKEEFIDLSLGRRPFSRIIKDQFDHPLEGADMIGLNLVVVPSLHHLGIGGGNIHLTELQKEFLICPEYLHHSSPFIRDHSQHFCPHPMDHFILLNRLMIS
jgi:hypothetical protein